MIIIIQILQEFLSLGNRKYSEETVYAETYWNSFENNEARIILPAECSFGILLIAQPMGVCWGAEYGGGAGWCIIVGVPTIGAIRAR